MKEENVSSGASLLGRLAWMVLGPIVLMIATISIINAGPGWLTAADIVFLTVLAVMLLGRCLEFWGGAPMTATGEPATPADLRRYLVIAFLAGMALWVVANLVANYWLT